jgi:hypothetical protein
MPPCGMTYGAISRRRNGLFFSNVYVLVRDRAGRRRSSPKVNRHFGDTLNTGFVFKRYRYHLMRMLHRDCNPRKTDDSSGRMPKHSTSDGVS